MTAAPHAGAPATPALTIHDGQVRAKSTDIASFFGKRHDNVLQQIDTLLEQVQAQNTDNQNVADFNRLNFQAVEYADAKGEARRAYELTRDGFTLLAMGFTGPRAMQFKIAYITAFNQMEAELRRLAAGPGAAQPRQLADSAGEKINAEDRREIARTIFARTRGYLSYLNERLAMAVYPRLNRRFGIRCVRNLNLSDLPEALAFIEALDIEQVANEVITDGSRPPPGADQPVGAPAGKED